MTFRKIWSLVQYEWKFSNFIFGSIWHIWWYSDFGGYSHFWEFSIKNTQEFHVKELMEQNLFDTCLCWKRALEVGFNRIRFSTFLQRSFHLCPLACNQFRVIHSLLCNIYFGRLPLFELSWYILLGFSGNLFLFCSTVQKDLILDLAGHPFSSDSPVTVEREVWISLESLPY